MRGSWLLVSFLTGPPLAETISVLCTSAYGEAKAMKRPSRDKLILCKKAAGRCTIIPGFSPIRETPTKPIHCGMVEVLSLA